MGSSGSGSFHIECPEVADENATLGGKITQMVYGVTPQLAKTLNPIAQESASAFEELAQARADFKGP